ncbi:MAG: hypothetical protein EBR30_02375 [Cytophagia bacterium]|nr:hypothetical protein [Cytophagia bacterium]
MKTPISLIGISGKIGSGKDTVAQIIQILSKYPNFTSETVANSLGPPSRLTEDSGWGIRKFAGKLKEVASILTGIPAYMFESQEFKLTDLGNEWAYYHPEHRYDDGSPVYTRMSVRQFLQKLGTEAMRNGLHTDTWVNATFSNYNPATDKWLITDTRFPNEAVAVKKRGGVLLRINRNHDTGSHPSEIALDNYEFDYVINNDGDMKSLVDKVRVFCEACKIITP